MISWDLRLYARAIQRRKFSVKCMLEQFIPDMRTIDVIDVPDYETDAIRHSTGEH